MKYLGKRLKIVRRFYGFHFANRIRYYKDKQKNHKLIWRKLSSSKKHFESRSAFISFGNSV